MKSIPDTSTVLAGSALETGIPVYRLTDKTVPVEDAIRMIVAAQEKLLLSGGATREEIQSILGRTKIHVMVERGELSAEHIELLAVLEKQYSDMVATLKRYELIKENSAVLSLPTWEQIRNCLDAEMLEKARKLEEPTLVIVPPWNRQTIVKAIDAHRINGQENETYVHELGNDDLWNGGKPEATETWEVVIVTGMQDVKADNNIRGTNYQRAKSWIRKYTDEGVDVMNDVRTYLTLLMRSLTVERPIDKESWTVLNAKNCTESSLVARGGWGGVRIRLNRDFPGFGIISLRSRGLIRVM